jgi:cytoskeletal protein CcmA (bactofilin family)
MFRKKKGENGEDEATAEMDADDISAPPLKPFSKKGSHVPTKPPAASTFRQEIPRRTVDIPSTQRRVDRVRPGEIEGKKLIVGRDICLSGEITSCDKLVVEGQVEVSLSDARIIEVAPSGFFKGNARVDEADISGRYEGELVVREKLTLRATGRISGSIRYGRIVIESGGEISGEMQSLSQADQEAVAGPAPEPLAPEPQEPEPFAPAGRTYTSEGK